MAATAAEAGDLPADAAEILTAFEQRADAIREHAEQKIDRHRQRLLHELQDLQDCYTRAAKLDEAVAVRDAIRQLIEQRFDAQPDPGTMSAYHAREGQSFYFRVTGSTSGSIYGTHVYTSDSSLAVACVHSGVLEAGETGIVKVTMLPGQPSYEQSTRNGVTSNAWSSYSSSYKVERAAQRQLMSPSVKHESGRCCEHCEWPFSHCEKCKRR